MTLKLQIKYFSDELSPKHDLHRYLETMAANLPGMPGASRPSWKLDSDWVTQNDLVF